MKTLCAAVLKLVKRYDAPTLSKSVHTPPLISRLQRMVDIRQGGTRFQGSIICPPCTSICHVSRPGGEGLMQGVGEEEYVG